MKAGDVYDCILVGVGLQNSLIVLALAALRPGTRVALVERASQPYGSHTWCFHAGDVPSDARDFVAPAIAMEWSRYRVRFPGYEREIEQSYAVVSVASLREAMRSALERLDAELFFGCAAREVSAHQVTLVDGRVLTGRLVVDARGPTADLPHTEGYQKFVGYELRLAHGCPFVPRVMDAAVPQHDGFRFMYALPLAPDRVLLEDTYYSRSPHLDTAALGARIFAYAEQHGLEVLAVERTEQGVLPLPGRPSLTLPAQHEPLRAGFWGGYFHPVTGYSFPLALRLALLIASLGPAAVRGAGLAALLSELRAQARFLCLLNRLFFRAMPDPDRRNVLERFYRLPEPSVQRFYAMALTRGDRARLLCGRPPSGFSALNALKPREPRLS